MMTPDKAYVLASLLFYYFFPLHAKPSTPNIPVIDFQSLSRHDRLAVINQIASQGSDVDTECSTISLQSKTHLARFLLSDEFIYGEERKRLITLKDGKGYENKTSKRRKTKPLYAQNVIELGILRGHTSLILSIANFLGQSTFLEINRDHIEQAKRWIATHSIAKEFVLADGKSRVFVQNINPLGSNSKDYAKNNSAKNSARSLQSYSRPWANFIRLDSSYVDFSDLIFGERRSHGLIFVDGDHTFSGVSRDTFSANKPSNNRGWGKNSFYDNFAIEYKLFQ